MGILNHVNYTKVEDGNPVNALVVVIVAIIVIIKNFKVEILKHINYTKI